jgi:hypothetical protein
MTLWETEDRVARRAGISFHAALAFLFVGIALAAPICALAVEAQAQNPDPEALIKSVWDHQKQLEELRKYYIFHRKDEDQNLDSSGNVKSADVREYEVHFTANEEIERLLSKNGKPISQFEEHVQDDEVRRQESRARKRAAKRESEDDTDKNEFTVSKFLAADRFFNLRKVNFKQHEVYAMDFEPRKDFEPHSLLDRILAALGGTIWIDESAKQIVRLEARFLASVKVGGGIVGAVEKGGNVVLEQRFLNGEIWMPSYSEVHINERVFFLHRPLNIVSTYSDYRKFRVSSRNAHLEEPPPPIRESAADRGLTL